MSGWVGEPLNNAAINAANYGSILPYVPASVCPILVSCSSKTTVPVESILRNYGLVSRSDWKTVFEELFGD